MLAFNKDAVSERTDEQLEKLQNEVVEKIKEIENATEFPRKQTALCNYCGFKNECPSFKHQEELKEKEIEEFKEDEGVKLVDEFSEIKIKLAEFKEKEEEFKEKLIAYAKQFGVDVVYGSNNKCSVKEIDKIVLPEDKEELIQLMKDKGIWDDLAMINFMRLQSKFMKGDFDEHEDIKDKIGKEKDFRLSLSRRKDGGEGE